MKRVEVDVVSITSDRNGPYCLVLREKNGERDLYITTTKETATSVENGIAGKSLSPPGQHDLMKILIERFSQELEEVEITDEGKNAVYARLLIGPPRAEVAAQIIDAVSLALRFRVPIYVTERVLQANCHVSKPVGATSAPAPKPEPAQKPPPQRPQAPKPKALQATLRDAIAKEDYEKAAQIRDEIRRLGRMDEKIP